MKKFLLGVALGAVIATAFRVQVIVPRDEDEQEDGTQRAREMLARHRQMRAALGAMAAVTALRSAIERAQAEQGDDEGDHSDLAGLPDELQAKLRGIRARSGHDAVQVRELRGADAERALDEAFPGLRDALKSRFAEAEEPAKADRDDA